MKLFLVRHGQDEDNARGILNRRRNTGLTESGRQQSYTVAQKLKDCSIDVIYTSPLARAYQTAQIIANVIKVDEVIVEQNLIERDFGILTGKPVTDIPRYADKIITSDKVNYFLDVEGAEDFPALYDRARKVVLEIQQRHSDNTVLIVTHGDIGKMIRGVYCGWSWEKSLQTPYFDNTEIIALPGK
jgi:broad specificity phosphatase PhoE